MKVAIIGSRIDEENEEKSRAMFEAASQIGAQLARRGHTIIVGSDDDKTIDYHIVKGALTEKTDTEVIIFCKPDDDGKFPFNTYNSNGHNISYKPYSFLDDWNIVQMHEIYESDAVLLLGGKLGTIRSGITANFLDKPVIPIGYFGGGAEEVWNFANRKRDEFYGPCPDETMIDRFRSPWVDEKDSEYVIDSLEKVAKAKAIQSTGMGVIFAAAITMLFGLAGTISFFYSAQNSSFVFNDIQLNESLYLILIVVLFAGPIGSSMKSLWELEKGKALTWRKFGLDLILGLGAGFLSVLIYFSAETALTGSIFNIKETKDLLRVMLVVTIGAIFTALYLDTAFEKFASTKSSILIKNIK